MSLFVRLTSYTLPAFASLLRMTPTVLRGPLRVRALVEVRWPRTGKPAAMANATITVDRLEAFQIALHFAAKIAFDRDFVRRDRLNDFVDLLRRQILCAQVRIDIGLFEDALRRCSARCRKYR